MSEPTTDAGRWLDSGAWQTGDPKTDREQRRRLILAIEAEARATETGLDVERLARSLRVVFLFDAETGTPPPDETLHGFAVDVAARYAALRSPDTETAGEAG